VRVRVSTYAAAAVAAVGLTVAAAYGFGWSFQKAAYLAPIVVASAGAVAALLILWTRVAWESLRHQRHPWRIVAIGVGAIALIVGLSVLGVELPRE
jgi:hypothetical protein